MRFLQPVVHERTKNWSLHGQKRGKWRRGANPDVTGISDGELCQRDRVSPGYTRSQIRKTPDLQKYTSDTLRRLGSQILKPPGAEICTRDSDPSDIEE